MTTHTSESAHHGLLTRKCDVGSDQLGQRHAHGHLRLLFRALGPGALCEDTAGRPQGSKCATVCPGLVRLTQTGPPFALENDTQNGGHCTSQNSPCGGAGLHGDCAIYWSAAWQAVRKLSPVHGPTPRSPAPACDEWLRIPHTLGRNVMV